MAVTQLRTLLPEFILLLLSFSCHALLALPLGLPILPFDHIVSLSLFSREYLGNFVFFLYKGRKPALTILLPFAQPLTRNSKVQTSKSITIFTNLMLVSSYKLLGVHLVQNLSWSIHCGDIVKTARKRLYALKVLRKSGLPLVYLIQVYCSLLQPILEFASPVWAALPTCLVQFVEGVEKSALRIIFPDFSYESPLVNCGLPTVLVRRNEACRRFTSNIKGSSVLAHLLQQPTNVTQGCRLRSCFSVLNSAL